MLNFAIYKHLPASSKSACDNEQHFAGHLRDLTAVRIEFKPSVQNFCCHRIIEPNQLVPQKMVLFLPQLRCLHAETMNLK